MWNTLWLLTNVSIISITCCTSESYETAFCGHWKRVGPHFDIARHLAYNRPLDKYHKRALVVKCSLVLRHFQMLSTCTSMFEWVLWGVVLMWKYEVQRKVSRPGTPQTWHLKNRGKEVQRKVGRPGTPQTWHLENSGKEVQRKVGRPGIPQTWHLKNRGNEVQLNVDRLGAHQTCYFKNRGKEVQLYIDRPGTP